jgi:hypothetical protein
MALRRCPQASLPALCSLVIQISYSGSYNVGSQRGRLMSEVIHALIGHEHVSFGPEDVAKLVAGFESALIKLDLKDRNDPATNLVAKLIIQFAKDGERDPNRLADRATRIVRGST